MSGYGAFDGAPGPEGAAAAAGLPHLSVPMDGASTGSATPVSVGGGDGSGGYGGGSYASSRSPSLSATGGVEAAELSVAAMEALHSGDTTAPTVADALNAHLFLEYPVDAAVDDGGVADNMTSYGRYYPSHVPYRVPRMERLKARPRIRVMIVVTLYSEDGDELQRTLEGIAQNVTNFNRASEKQAAEGMPWHEIVVVFVADGLLKISKSCIAKAESLGMIFEDAIFNSARGIEMTNPHTGRQDWIQLVDPDEVQLHCFEFAPQLVPSTERLRSKYGPRYAPVQCVFTIKQHNAGKLDSHKVFFDAFCAEYQPEYVCLVDIGTRAADMSICNLINCMRNNQDIGGCCGEIAVGEVSSDGKKSGGPCATWSNFVVASQMFEYKISHVMDKALESWCGYITVLPGAFSAYRYAALVGDPAADSRGRDDRGVFRRPLDKYFASRDDPHTGYKAAAIGAFDANMYLAEDRILCFEIVASQDRSYTLHYEKNSPAYTDVPSELADLLKQRRRWLNGSFFAMLYALGNFGRVFSNTRHGTLRKLVFMLELVYFAINAMVTWLIVGSMYLSFYLVLLNTFPEGGGYQALSYVLQFAYLLTTGTVFVLSLGNDAKAERRWFRGCGYMYALLVIVTTVMAVAHIASSAASTLVIVGSLLLVATYIFTSAIHGQLPYIIGSFLQYYVMVPVFVNVFSIYSMANVHDVSWGTKGLDTASAAKAVGRKSRRVNKAEAARITAEQKHAAEVERERAAAEKKRGEDVASVFRSYRTKWVLGMMASNWIYVTTVTKYVLPNNEHDFIVALGTVVLGLLGIRVLGSVLYQAERVLKATCCRGYADQQAREARQRLL